MGLQLDPWQQLVVRVALAEDARGLYAAREVGYLVSRQNGKGAALEAIALHGMFLVGDPLTLWTAHQFKTSSEAFLRMKSWIEGSPDLSRHLKRVISAHGEEGFELHSGVRLRFLARSKSSGRGFSPQRIIFDEAQELAKVAAEAMLPSMRAQKNRQAIYTGTVPGPDINNPDHWRRLRDRGRSEDPGRLAWLEWTPKGSDNPQTAGGVDLDSRRVWAAANPGVGYRDGLDLESLAADRESLSEDSFARECLSVWPADGVVSSVIDLGQWAALRNQNAPEPSTACVVVDVAPDRAWSSIGVAASAGEKTLLLVKHGRGTGWVVDELVRLDTLHDIVDVAAVRGQADALVPDIEAAGLEVGRVLLTELGAATAAFIIGVAEGRYVHVGQPELDAAVANLKTRMVGEVEVPDRRDWSGPPISPFVAVAAAALRWVGFREHEYDLLESIG